MVDSQPNLPKKFILPAVVLTIAVEFLWDVWTPSDVTDWVWYFIPIFMSGWLGGRNFAYGVAAVISVLVLVSYSLSPVGIDPQLALTSRLVGICGLWMSAVLIAFHKDTKAVLQRSERAARMASDCTQMLVRAENEEELLRKICQIIADVGGYRMTWVGFANNDASKTVRVAAVAGHEDGYLEQANISWDEKAEGGRGPTGIALRTGEVVVSNYFANDVRTQPWHKNAAQRGYAASICLPLKNAGKNFGVLVIYAGEKNAFHPNEVQLLAELADDLAFGIHVLRARLAQQTAEREKEASRIRLELSTSATGLGIWEWNVVTNKIRWDAQMFRLYGVVPTVDKFVDYSVWRNAVLPEDLAQQEALLQATVRRGGSGHRMFRIRRADDGGWRWIEAMETVRRNDQGQVEWVLGTNLDVTERTLAAEKLQASQSRLELLITNTPAIIYSLRATPSSLSPKLEVTFISPNVEKILGHPPGRFVQNPSFWFENLHPEDANKMADGFSAETARGMISREYRFRHGDGSYRWMRDEMRAISNGNEQPTEFVGHWFDITEQKQAREALREREEIFSSIVSQAADAIALVGMDGRFVEFNAAAHEMLGYSREEFVRMRIADVEAEQSPEEIRANIERIMRSGSSVFDSKHRHRNGHVRMVRVNARRIELHGHTYITAVWSDITERVNTEKQLHESLMFFREGEKIARIGAWKVSPATDFLHWTEGVYDIIEAPLDYKPGLEEGLRFYDAESIPPLRAALQKALQDGTPFVVEAGLTTMRGRHLWTEVRGLARVEEDGQPYVMGTFQDITERKEYAAELARSRDFYLNLLKNAPALVWRAGTDAKCDWFNESWLRFTGRKMEQEVGDGWVEGVHPDDVQRCMEHYLDAFRHRLPFEIEYRLRRHDGQYRWIADHGVPFNDLSGNFSGYVGYCFDVTDRKLGEDYDHLHVRVLQLIATNAPLPDILVAILKLLECGHEDWRGSIMLTDKTVASLSCAAAPGLPDFFKEGVKEVPVGMGVGSCGTACATRQKVFVEDIATHPYWEAFRELTGRAGLRACWSIPIISVGGDVLGALAVYRTLPSLPTDQEVMAMESIMDLARVAITKARAEEALLESKHRLEMALNAANMGVWEYDFTTQNLYWSPELFRNLGLPPIVPSREAMLKYVHPDDVQISEAAMNKAVAERGVYHCEYRIIVDGKTLWLEDRGELVWDDKGRPLKVVGTAQDITDRKRVENELRKLSQAVEQNPSSVVITDALGNIEYVNPRFTEVTGYTLDEVRGQNPRLLKSGQMPPGVYKQLWGEISSGRDWRGELVNRKKDGSFHTEIVVISPVKNTEGVITNFVAVKEDISERKKLEENQVRLATAIEQAGETVVITDTEGVILYANPAFEKTSGYTRREAIGQNPRLLKSGRQGDAFYRDLWATLRRGETWQGRFVNQRKDGSHYQEDAVISPIRNAAGIITNYVAVKRDVTRESQLERQLFEAQKMEAVGQLAGGVAHDYNNILAATVLHLSMLMAMPNLDPEMLEGLAELKKGADRAAALTRQLLLFSRRQMPQRRNLEMNSLIDGTLKMLRRLLGEQVELSVRLHAGDAWVEADPGMMEQVLMNLCINARDAMPAGGILTVTVQLEKVEAERPHPDAQAGNYVCLTVADTGSGMSPETMERIFEPFFTTKEVGKGTGLGLATVHGIVKQHGGWVEVSSQLGKGSRFRVYLPAVAGRAQAVAAPQNKKFIRGDEALLVVEDEEMLRRPLVQLLKFAGYKVSEAKSGREALELWRQRAGALDLLITDMVMPGGMSGLDLARALKAEHPSLPVILMSGYSQELAAVDMKARPDFIFLTKPYDAEALSEHIRRMLDYAKANRPSA